MMMITTSILPTTMILMLAMTTTMLLPLMLLPLLAITPLPSLTLTIAATAGNATFFPSPQPAVSHSNQTSV